MYMLLSQLKELIADVSDDALIVVATDAEGNSFSPLESLEKTMYVGYTKWSGYLLDPEDEDEDDEAVLAVVLYPRR